MKKIVWLVVSYLMALSLVMASCGEAEPEGEVEVGEEEVIVTEEEVEEEVVEEEEELLPPEVPKYGGMLTIVGSDPAGFDEAITYYTFDTTLRFTNEELQMGNWAMGPAGTGEHSWTFGNAGRTDVLTGCLAESWDIPDDETIIYHIRPGVKWQNIPPVNGREFTADDAAWNMERNFKTPTSYIYNSYPPESGYQPTSIKALDKYTVELKVPSTMLGMMVLVTGGFMFMLPPDMVEEYGDMTDWKNACGTGPFMLTDYVAATSVTYEKNPDYWQYDPLHPENHLPYIDTVKELVISDTSTQLAALRTGKLDRHSAISWEDAEQLLKQCPELEYKKVGGQPCFLAGRMDKEELPFKDIRVRQALNLAVNQQEIVDEYFGGNAYLLGYPSLPVAEMEAYYTPLEEMPTEPTVEGSACSVPELFTYNPEKARQLLADAGYPEGFKTQAGCSSASGRPDYLSILKEYLLDVGVDMEINIVESSVARSVERGRTYPEMWFSSVSPAGLTWRMLFVRKESAMDISFFEHERTRATYEALSKAVGIDDAEVCRLLKEIGPFELEQAWSVWLPSVQSYTMWWPWLQNFHGESDGGYFNPNRHWQYVWIDEALKKSMGY